MSTEHASRWIVTFQLALLGNGCAQKDAALAQGNTADSASSASREAGPASSYGASVRTERPTAADSDAADVPVLDAATDDASPPYPTALPTLSTDASTTLEAGTSDDAGSHAAVDPTTSDAPAFDSGLRDRELCEGACLPSAELPCASAECLGICLEEFAQPCAKSYRPYLECLASRDASEFACDVDNLLLAPTACSSQEEAFVACLRQ